MAAKRNNKFICQYSGLAQQLMFIDGPGPSGWSLVGGMDPGLPFLEHDDGVAFFRRRKGVANAVPTPSCPYTGVEVVFEYRNGLWWATGNIFKPYKTWAHKEELIYFASFRNGKTRRKEPKIAVVHAVEERVEHSDPNEGLSDGREIAPMLEEYLADET